MDLSTNIIRNVYNIGTNSCDVGTQYCTDGYALYFPCLKNITKGQDVCFDFYVVDYAGRTEYVQDIANGGDGSTSGKELTDLRDVNAISLNLTGAFGCQYGTFSYPDDIESLQLEKYPIVYSDDFGKRKVCILDIQRVEIDNDGPYYNITDNFYSGTNVTVSAKNTPTHIFEGWAIITENEEECTEDTIYDDIVSHKPEYTFTIIEDTYLVAVYRPRKVYTVISATENLSSYFDVNYNHISYILSNRINDGFDDIEAGESEGSAFDSIEVLEGYKMAVKCIPSADRIGNDQDGDTDTRFRFEKWIDGYDKYGRVFTIGEDTSVFENGDIIALNAICYDNPIPYYDLENIDLPYSNEFDEDGIHIETGGINPDIPNIDDMDFYGDEHIINVDDVCQMFIDTEGYLYFNNGGSITIDPGDIEEGIKIIVHAKSDDSCELQVIINVNGNDYTSTKTISSHSIQKYEFYFSKCAKSNIVIKSIGTCLVDKIEVCREEFVDKGKARLCLDSKTTSNIPSGPLSVNGAIMVNGQSYGLASTQIGIVNKLPKITLNIE